MMLADRSKYILDLSLFHFCNCLPRTIYWLPLICIAKHCRMPQPNKANCCIKKNLLVSRMEKLTFPKSVAAQHSLPYAGWVCHTLAGQLGCQHVCLLSFHHINQLNEGEETIKFNYQTQVRLLSPLFCWQIKYNDCKNMH